MTKAAKMTKANAAPTTKENLISLSLVIGLIAIIATITYFINPTIFI